MAMNEQDQVIHSISDKQFEILVFNNTEDVITLSNNILIGSLSPAEKVRDSSNAKNYQLPSKKTISSKDSLMNNTPSTTTKSAHVGKTPIAYIKDNINPDDNQVFDSQPKILDKLYWTSLWRIGIYSIEKAIQGGTNLIEHPCLHSEREPCSIKIKNRPINPRPYS